MKEPVLPHNDDGANDDKVQRRKQSLLADLAASKRELVALRQERVEGLHGEAFKADAADDLAEDLEQRIRADINAGQQRHTPASRGQRTLARIAPFADFLVFLYFLAVVLNVDWNNPRNTPVVAVLALLLAVIATAGVAWTLRSVAGRYRQNKPEDGRFRWRQRTRQGGMQLDQVLLATILTAVGVMMFYRIFDDARSSELPVAPSILVAFFFGLVAAALNYIIFLVEFSDGSTVTDELRHLRAQLEPIEGRVVATERRMRELQQRLDALRDREEPAGTPSLPRARQEADTDERLPGSTEADDQISFVVDPYPPARRNGSVRRTGSARRSTSVGGEDPSPPYAEDGGTSATDR